MNQGLASLPVKRFQDGGFSIGPAAPSSPAIGLGGLTAPAVSIGTPIGEIGVTPMDMVSLAVPALAAPNMAINAINALAAFNAQQEPAPVTTLAVSPEVEVSPIESPIAQVSPIAALTAMNAEQEAEEGIASDVDSVADAVAAAQAATDAAEADAGVGVGTAGVGGESDAGPGEGGGDSGAGSSDGGGDSGGDGGDGGSSGSDGGGDGGEKAGGVIGLRKYQLGGNVMGMGDSQPRYAYAPPMMAGGGVAEAKQVQNQGRGPDTMLVHMAPREVAGLQALAMAHGGSLTINPQTGLPEAGFLSSLLPMAIGAALAPMTAGTSLAFLGTPMGAALTVGGLTGLATGSLGKGLMAGLGAFGGASLGAGLVGAESIGAQQAGIGASQEAALAQAAEMESARAAAMQAEAAKQTALMGGEAGAKQAFADYALNPDLFYSPPGLDTSLVTQAGNQAIAAKPFDMAAIQAAKEKGISDFASKPLYEQLTGSFDVAKTQPIKDTFTGLGGMKAVGPLAGPVLAEAAKPKPLSVAKTPSQVRPYSLDVANISAAKAPLYSPGSTQEREMLRYAYSPMPMYRAAEGGEVDPDYDMQMGGIAAFSDAYEEGGVAKLAKMRKSLKGAPYYKFAQDRRDSSMEASVEQNLAAGGALPPRFLSGGGDGMSDSIKANIDGKQEARLADGEFVVPADVVSHLGNGSSKAGAKKLYSMMDRIRSARTGQKKQAPEVKAERYMPA